MAEVITEEEVDHVSILRSLQTEHTGDGDTDVLSEAGTDCSVSDRGENMRENMPPLKRSQRIRKANLHVDI